MRSERNATMAASLHDKSLTHLSPYLLVVKKSVFSNLPFRALCHPYSTVPNLDLTGCTLFNGLCEKQVAGAEGEESFTMDSYQVEAGKESKQGLPSSARCSGASYA